MQEAIAGAPTPSTTDRPRTIAGRVITTRAERKVAIAAARKAGVRLTKTGRRREDAEVKRRVAIDRNHIEAIKRDTNR